MNYLRKSIRPAKEFILQLSRLDSDFIQESTVPFLKDLLDLIIQQAVEIIDTYREMLSDHLDIYNTGVSNRLNEIMKVLAIFSAVCIPLTFIAGIYGTNFEYLPGLHYRYSYFVFLGFYGVCFCGNAQVLQAQKLVVSFLQGGKKMQLTECATIREEQRA